MKKIEVDEHWMHQISFHTNSISTHSAALKRIFHELKQNSKAAPQVVSQKIYAPVPATPSYVQEEETELMKTPLTPVPELKVNLIEKPQIIKPKRKRRTPAEMRAELEKKLREAKKKTKYSF